MVAVRWAEPADYPQLVHCVRREYGENYADKRIYHEDSLAAMNRSGELRFLVAEEIGPMEAGEAFAGMLGIRRERFFSGCWELTLLIVPAAKRGRGIARRLLEQAVATLKGLPSTFYLGYSVTYHSLSQKLMEEMGMAPGGFLFHRYDSSLLWPDRFQKAGEKHHFCIMAGPMGGQGQTQARNLDVTILPRAAMPVVHRVYGRLGYTGNLPEKEENPRPRWERTVNSTHRTWDLYVHSNGMSYQQLKRVLEDAPSGFTGTVFLSMGIRDCATIYDELCGSGYYFAGLLPFSRRGGYLILHKGPFPTLETFSLTDSNAAFFQMLEKINGKGGGAVSTENQSNPA